MIRTKATASLEELAAFIDSFVEPIFVLDRRHGYVLANTAYCAAMGVARERLIGRTGAEFFSEAQLKESLAQDDRVFATGKPDASDTAVKNAVSGETRSVSLIKTLFTDQAGDKFIVGIFRDCSARLRAQIEWERTFNAVPDLIAIMDQESRILRVNQALARRFGLRPEECVGRHCYEIFHDLPYEPDYCPHALTNADGREHIAETYDERLKTHFIRSVTPILDADGRMAGVVEVMRDIAAQKRTEAELQEAAKLKSDLISLVNHEYANALTNMTLALTLLKSSETEPPEPLRTRSYEALGRAIENLRTFTANFLNLHRLESGKFELNLQPVPVGAVVRDALSALQPLAEAKELRLDIETGLPETPPVTVRADRDCLALIISNLVTNAVKYTPKGGKITIRLGRKDEQVMVSVEDSGIGMSAQDLERIKPGFFRTQEGRDTAPGFGFGLMLVTQLLDKHGSRLEIESSPGRGSRFSFSLPVWRKD